MVAQQSITALMLTLGLLAAAPVSASPQCTESDRSLWQDQDGFRQGLENRGYRIRSFKVTSGNCYEIYGWDDKGARVEIYFDPVSGRIVKQEVND